MKFRDVEAKKDQNKQKQTKTLAQHSSPPRSLPPQAFHKPRKVDRENLAMSGRGNHKEPSERKDVDESVWERNALKREHFQDEDQVMTITVPKKGERCRVLYLTSASESEDMRLANRATFPVGTSVEDILDRRPPKRENQSVFREYKTGTRNERKLEPFTFDNEALPSSSTEDRRRLQTSPDVLARPVSPQKRNL
jgi:hypothetical protein